MVMTSSLYEIVSLVLVYFAVPAQRLYEVFA
jgi:hypothetical protein